MPYSSAQISGLVGGQMAMFSNQQQYSQQISGLYGTGPQMQMAGGMQNPFPEPPSFGQAGAGGPQELGAYMTQGMAGAVPGLMGAASLAGGFMGGAAGWLDPFTGVGRSFMSGTGGAFAGLGSAVTGGYKAGGLLGAARGGWGALGGIGAGGVAGGIAGGLGSAAATGGLYYAATLPIMEAAEQFGAGAQSVADVGMLARQHMGPQYGMPGARTGGGMGRTQIREMVGVLEELASQDVMVTMDSLKRLMDQAGQAGMLQGIGSAQEFKQKFSGIVRQMKEVASAMGTSLEEAAPLFGQMRQMGLWSTQEIMGTAGAIRAVGPQAAPQMMATMQQGAQLSHAMGGRLGAGAAMGQQAFLDIQSAVRTGVLAPEAIREFTGGVGGVEGQRMVAQQMQGVMGRFSGTAMGKLMMAGLGEFREGAFTGGIDREMMERFMAGGISVGELQRIGQQRTRTQEGATSWDVRKGAIGQEMMATGGMEGLSAAITQVMKKSRYGKAGANVQNKFIQLITGVDARQAEMIRNLGNELPRIQEDKQRRLEAALEDQFREVDRRMNRSWQGFKDSLGQAWDESWRPMRELGADVATGLGRRMDRAMDTILGRTKQFGMSTRQMQSRMWSAEGLGTGAGMPELTTAGRYGMRAETPFLARMRNLTQTGRGMFGLGAVLTGGGTDAEMLSRMGAETIDVGPGGVMPEGFVPMNEGGVGAGALIGAVGGAVLTAGNPLGIAAGGFVGGLIQKNLGTATGRMGVRASDRAEIIQGAMGRAEDRTWEGLGFQGDKKSSKNQANLNKAKSAMRRLLASDTKLASDFAKYKEDNPEAFKQTQWLMRELGKKDPEAAAAIQELSKDAGGPNTREKMLNTVALVIEDAGIKGPWAPDYDKDNARARGMQMFSSTEEYNTAISETIEMAAEMADPTAANVALWAAGGAVLGSFLPGLGTLVGGALGAVGGYLLGGQEDTRTFLEEIMQSDYGETFAKAMAGDEDAVKELHKLPQEALEKWGKLHEMFGDKDKIRQVGKQLTKVTGQRLGKARLESMQRASRLAKEELRAGVDIKGETGDKLSALLKTYASSAYGEGKEGAQKTAEELAGELIRGGDLGALAEKGGAIGQGLAQLGQMRRRIGKLTTGRGVTMEQLEKKMGKFGIPEGMKEELQKMLESGGEFTQEELSQFQEEFTKRASRGEVVTGGTTAGRRAGTERLTELLTSYAEANAKFVFAVGASMQDVDVKDLQAKAARLLKESSASSNPATRPGAA